MSHVLTSRLLDSVNGIMMFREKEGREGEKEGGRKEAGSKLPPVPSTQLDLGDAIPEGYKVSKLSQLTFQTLNDFRD